MMTWKKSTPYFVLFLLLVTAIGIIHFRSAEQLLIFKPGSGLSNVFYFDNVRSDNGNVSIKKSGEFQNLIHGPYVNLDSGVYQITLNFSLRSKPITEKVLRIEVTSDLSQTMLLEREYSSNDFRLGVHELSYELNLDNGVNLLETRIFTDYSGFVLNDVEISKANAGFVSLSKLINFKLFFASVLVVLLLFILHRSFRPSPLFIFTLIFLLMIIVTLFLPKHSITGDEPHYLFNTKNLVVNKTLDIAKAYAPEIMSEFWQGQIDKYEHMHQSIKTGVYYSHHGYLMSVLIIPGYMLAGEVGVKMQMCIILFATLVLHYLILRKLNIDKNITLVSTTVLIIFTPLIFYSYAIYPEIIAAFVFLLGIYASLTNYLILKITSLVLLGMLIFLKSKYLIPVLIISAFVVMTELIVGQRFQINKLRSVRVAILLLAFFLAFSSYFIINYELFGNFSLFSYYSGGSGDVVDRSLIQHMLTLIVTTLANIFGSRAGLLIWVPVAVIAPLGLVNLLSGKSLKNVMIGLTLAFSTIGYMLFYSASGSIGGASPPLRPWIAVLPLVSILVVLALRYVKNYILVGILLAASLYQVLVSVVYKTSVLNIYSFKFNPVFTDTGSLFSHLGLLTPQYTARRMVEYWDIATTLFLLAFFTIILILLIKDQKELLVRDCKIIMKKIKKIQHLSYHFHNK